MYLLEFVLRFLDRSCGLILAYIVARRFGHVFDT